MMWYILLREFIIAVGGFACIEIPRRAIEAGISGKVVIKEDPPAIQIYDSLRRIVFTFLLIMVHLIDVLKESRTKYGIRPYETELALLQENLNFGWSLIWANYFPIPKIAYEIYTRLVLYIVQVEMGDGCESGYCFTHARACHNDYCANWTLNGIAET